MQHGNNYIQTSGTLSTTQTTLLAAQPTRKSLVIFNTGTVDLLFGVGTATITVKAGDHVAFLDRPPINALVGKSSTGTANYSIWVV